MAKMNIRGIVKKVLIVLVIAFVIIQFFRPARNVSAAVTEKNITRMYTVPDSVQVILQKACYDCHSNNTRYPWYYNIQPVAWWMNDHINDAKKELNFSEFSNRPAAKQVKKLKKCAKEVQENGMPLQSYLWEHKEAVLTDREKNILIDWFTNLSDQISAKLPPQQQ
jgi:heme-binding protein